MEYFNTFGGNPVSCAAALAVLDVIADERLQANAARVGARMIAGLRELAQRHALIGDVRGAGLFIGVELTRATGDPATAEAAAVVERARRARVLLSTDGPGRNVLKIKPPMVVGEADADRLLEVLDAALR
jgi:4-aminobutyrate aminotransferase-like enzyme